MESDKSVIHKRV